MTLKSIPRESMSGVALAVITLAAAVLLSACAKRDVTAQEREKQSTAHDVTIVTIVPRAEMVYAELPGRIEPRRVAEVRARVPGIVMKRMFREGADVKAGDILFQIDPAPQRAALTQARGTLEKAEADLFRAKTVADRATQLVDAQAVSRQDYDHAVADLKQATAQRNVARAAVETATLNLGYTTVRAPIAGRIGRALVTEGALVGHDEATPLARIQQLHPIYADFRQPVADAMALREAFEAGRLTRDEKGQPKIAVAVGESRDFTYTGHLLFSDISVDPGTAQVTLRGEFDNPRATLLPGMYVRVRAEMGVDTQAIHVPQQAIRRAADGVADVLLVGTDERAVSKNVRTGAMQGGQWQILDGLTAGDRVIVEGSHNVKPGDKVRVVDGSASGDASKETT